jgi:hypothetical protein
MSLRHVARFSTNYVSLYPRNLRNRISGNLKSYVNSTLRQIVLGVCWRGCKKKVKLSLYRPWRPLGLWEVEAPTFSDIRLIGGGKVVNPMRRPLFAPGKFLVLISVRGWVDPRTIVWLEVLGKLKKSTSSGNRTGDLPIVPQPTEGNVTHVRNKINACSILIWKLKRKKPIWEAYA